MNTRGMKNQIISSRRWLLLPVEIKVREFEAKVMLSCIAADSGFGVILGPNGFNHNGSYPRGVYFDKCVSSYKAAFLDNQVNGLRNRLVSLDVEGLVYQTEQKWLSRRISQPTVDLSSLIFTWGDEQCRMIKSVYDIPEKLSVTGSPSADLWQKRMHFLYRDRVDDISRQYGQLILIPSNFSLVINANGPDFIFKQFIKNGFINSDEDLNLFNEEMAFHKRVFEKFIAAIPKIAEDNQDCTIILRPHPGDDFAIWRHLSTNWPKNVIILYEGNISPWILASRVMVHNSCSTGVEAFGMRKPAIAYMPYVDDRFDQNIPNPLSQQAQTVDKLLGLIKANLRQNGLGREPYKIKLYKRHVNYSKDEFAGDLIVEALKKLDLPESDFSLANYDVSKKLRTIAKKARRRINDLTGKNEFNHAYRKQKNPGITFSEVKSLMEIYKRELHLWSDVTAAQVDENVFCFFKR